MTADPSIDAARFLHEQLASASPDLLREMLATQLAGAVDGHTDKELVLAHERSPLVVEQGGVGLHGVRIRCPGCLRFSSSSRVRRKKSKPMRVGSPPWKATTTSSAPLWAARSWLM